MADMMNIPIIGGVMNMAYVDCPKCHEKIYPFEEPDLDELRTSCPVVSEVPFDTSISDYTDHGTIESLNVPYLDNLAQGVMDFIHLEEKR